MSTLRKLPGRVVRVEPMKNTARQVITRYRVTLEDRRVFFTAESVTPPRAGDDVYPVVDDMAYAVRFDPAPCCDEPASCTCHEQDPTDYNAERIQEAKEVRAW